MDKYPTATNGSAEHIVSYDISCQLQSVAHHLDTDTLVYLEDTPVLTPAECIFKHVSPGPYKDTLILRILRAGHRHDIFRYVQQERPDLWRRHQAAQQNAQRVSSAMQQMDRSGFLINLSSAVYN